MKQLPIKRCRTYTLAACLVSALSHGNAIGGDIEAGKSKSTVCAACHGANGISMIPNYPNLSGQKEQYLVDSLKAYRDGTRKNMIMAPMASGLTDDDIKNLAAYYASLGLSGKN